MKLLKFKIRAMESERPLFVIAPRRSGSNYLEALLIANLDITVANLNRISRVSDPRRPHLFDQFGGKHDLTADSLGLMALKGRGIVALSRNPVDWLIARARYHASLQPTEPHAALLQRAPQWAMREYCGFWHHVFRYIDSGGAGLILIRYEDLVRDGAGILNEVRQTLGLPPFSITFQDITREAKPGASFGGTFVKSDPLRRYSREEHVELIGSAASAFLPDVLERLGYSYL